MWKNWQEQLNEENGNRDATQKKQSSSTHSNEHPLMLVLVHQSKTFRQTYECYFLAMHLVQFLLLRRYRVRLSIASDSPMKVASETVNSSNIHDVEQRFLALSAAEDCLEVSYIAADFSELDYSFSGGVCGVFLVSWPVDRAAMTLSTPPDLQQTAELVVPVKKVLDLCQSTKSVQKLVFSSCLVAVTEEFDKAKTYDETDWNQSCTASNSPFAFR